MKHSKIFDQLRLIASDLSPVANARIASALVYRKEILSLGVCKYQTHPLQKKWGRNEESVYLHSEIDAIKNVLKRASPLLLRECSLFVLRLKYESLNEARFRAGGDCKAKPQLVDALARPCEGCQKCIDHYQIPRVYYTRN